MMLRTVLVPCALTLCSGSVPAAGAAFGDETPTATPAAVDLSGRWLYNRELSDDAREKMREGREKGAGPGGGRPPMGPGGGGGMGGPGGGGMGGGGGRTGRPPGGGGDDDPREAMRAILEPAEELAITQSGTEIAVDEKFGRTRRLHPDGRKYKTDNGTSEIKASWKEGKLLVETKRDRGTGVVEVWELVPDGSRIILNVKMQGEFGAGIALKRIYDRAPVEGGK